MIILVYIGVVIAVAGLGGIIWCILEGLAVKKSGLSLGEAQPRLRKMATVNLASVCLAFLGMGVAAAGMILA
ncbi:hypothetical protein ACQ5SO_14590 [Rhodovulum sp. DZ06]|uniref:hypothetical protein n=1 Tax=Rhodovulum sp. DZ06 TaxID=3425126 RepID=UPI003D32A5D0